jgi:hypothetical protein
LPRAKRFNNPKLGLFREARTDFTEIRCFHPSTQEQVSLRSSVHPSGSDEVAQDVDRPGEPLCVGHAGRTSANFVRRPSGRTGSLADPGNYNTALGRGLFGEQWGAEAPAGERPCQETSCTPPRA